ncbi:cell division protein FtsZ [Natronorubrum sp. JWXQ-INN-674]|uniref:Tubulin-like protein CetZ n=1 Tax=Natronorubrum halalkaliphilum TaxID=2691917 RepID=A0A6B0VLX4_9EURY|nr:cell division protein FtsZ [Natronorubrum halalkaliphilum]MXV62580.1 cell division protein FtsZ [Natronorubrum halalkaliphilum]
MQLEVIGIGGAGCRIAGAIRAAEPSGHSFIEDVFAFDTTDELLTQTADTAVPESHRYRYGDGIDGGLGGDLQRGFEVGEEHVEELDRALDEGTPTAADAFLVAVGLGGATGGGTAPALVATLHRQYDKPVYVLATLPADREFERGGDGAAESDSHSSESAPAAGAAEPSRPNAAANAVHTLERLDGLASAVICFDNDRWLRTGESLVEGRERCNRELATRVSAFFAAGAGGAGSGETIAETVIDASDVGRVMGSQTAIVTLGYGEQDVDTGGSRFGLGLFSAKPDVETSSAVSAIETVIRKGIHGKLTLECDPESAQRALLIVGGPPAWLNRQAIAEGRRALESTIGGRVVLGGDAPRPDGEAVFAAVVLADVGPVERLEELRAAAERVE